MMDSATLLAEKILMYAAKSNGGHCYPAQISANGIDLDNALCLLEMYGETFSTSRGAMPIFTINELGKHFASMTYLCSIKLINKSIYGNKRRKKTDSTTAKRDGGG